MASKLEILADKITERFGNSLTRVESTVGELTYELKPDELLDVCRALRDEEPFAFEQLMDVCGVDYLAYGEDEWLTQEATDSGFSRGVNREPWRVEQKVPRRFAVVYHLLSIKHNHRLRLRVFCAEDQDPPMVESVTGIWAAANWFEREAFDLYGILFANHPDLRRILTDYGFVGHPFRKDFPLIGNVEVRYDPEKGRVVYQPTSIEPRTLVPKVIRDDHRNEPAFKESSDNA